MKSVALIALVAVLLFVDVKGQMGSRGRCKCQDAGANMILPKNIEKLEVIPSSPSCPNMEIIVTLKDNKGQKCLNPEGRFAKNYVKRAIKKRSAQ